MIPQSRSRKLKHFRARTKTIARGTGRGTNTAADREAAAAAASIAEPPPLRPPQRQPCSPDQQWVLLRKQLLADAARLQLEADDLEAVAARLQLRQTTPKQRLEVCSLASDRSRGTRGSATYHVSIVHPPAQQWRSGRQSWLKEKRIIAIITTVTDELKLPYTSLCNEEGGGRGNEEDWHGIEMHDVESDWHECLHCGEEILSAWERCNCCRFPVDPKAFDEELRFGRCLALTLH